MKIKETAYQKTQKWRGKNPEKFREQWLRRYKKNAEVIKAKRRQKYKLLKEQNGDKKLQD